MKEPIKKAGTFNGQNVLLHLQDIEYTNRILTLTGPVTEELATEINCELRSLARESDEDITIYIQSGGGSVSAGLSILDTAKSIKCDIVTVASGMAASMAAFLLATAGTKGKRWCQPNAEVLIHQPLGGASGQETDIRIQAEHMLKVRARLNRLLSEATGKPIEKIEVDTERDYILTAEEALEYGLVDHIGDPDREN